MFLLVSRSIIWLLFFALVIRYVFARIDLSRPLDRAGGHRQINRVRNRADHPSLQKESLSKESLFELQCRDAEKRLSRMSNLRAIAFLNILKLYEVRKDLEDECWQLVHVKGKTESDAAVIKNRKLISQVDSGLEVAQSNAANALQKWEQALDEYHNYVLTASHAFTQDTGSSWDFRDYHNNRIHFNKDILNARELSKNEPRLKKALKNVLKSERKLRSTNKKLHAKMDKVAKLRSELSEPNLSDSKKVKLETKAEKKAKKMLDLQTRLKQAEEAFNRAAFEWSKMDCEISTFGHVLESNSQIPEAEAGQCSTSTSLCQVFNRDLVKKKAMQLAVENEWPLEAIEHSSAAPQANSKQRDDGTRKTVHKRKRPWWFPSIFGRRH